MSMISETEDFEIIRGPPRPSFDQQKAEKQNQNYYRILSSAISQRFKSKVSKVDEKDEEGSYGLPDLTRTRSNWKVKDLGVSL